MTGANPGAASDPVDHFGDALILPVKAPSVPVDFQESPKARDVVAACPPGTRVLSVGPPSTGRDRTPLDVTRGRRVASRTLGCSGAGFHGSGRRIDADGTTRWTP